MVCVRILLVNIQHLNRMILSQCEAGQYSETTKKLQQEIYAALLVGFNIQENGSKKRLLRLQVKLYQSGVLLFHHETENPSLSRGGYQAVSILDYALAFFSNALELAGHVASGTTLRMATLAALAQMGLVLKVKRLHNDAVMALLRALDVSCQIENSGDDSSRYLNFSACKSGVLQTLGDIQHEMGNLNQAYVLYKHAIEYCKWYIDGESLDTLVDLLEVVGRLSQRLHGMKSRDAAEYLELAQSLKEANAM
jgi:tetratricopeptide (TPR) repeat protein